LKGLKSDFKSTGGFFLLDAVVTLLIVSVVIIEIILFVLNAGGSGLNTNVKILESIKTGNRSAVGLFEDNKQSR